MYWILGFCGGLLAAVVATNVIKKARENKGKGGCKFDERQTAARGRAYRTGFITLIACICLTGIGAGTGCRICADPVVLFFGLFCGLLAFVLRAIKEDAYFGINENARGSMICVGLIGAVNLFLGFMSLKETGLWEEGMLSTGLLNLSVGAMLLIVMTAALIHRKKEASAEEAEEAEA